MTSPLPSSRAPSGVPSTRARLLLRRGLVAVGLFLASLAISAGISWLRWPIPYIHDEFSYLLAADTFCEGRLTNPAHPHWEHFESIHIIQQPTYASKYPPGQGLVMALGQYLTGEPLAGVWISTALAVVAFYWMLLGWLPSRWAFVGAILLLAHPSIQLVWGQSYWGGTVAFLGGALVCGAVPRLLRHPAVGTSLAMAVGAMTLAISRPYEGFVFCVLIGVYMLISWWRQGWPPGSVLVGKIAAPQIAAFALGGALLTHYNTAVTGHPFRMPYVVHEASYGLCPLFLWDTPSPEPTYRHQAISEFHHGWAMDWYYRQESIPGVVAVKSEMTQLAGQFYYPIPLALPLLFLPFGMHRRLWFVLSIVALCWLASMITVWAWPHYFGAIAPLLLLLGVWGLRNADAFSVARFGNLRLGFLLVAVYVCGFATDVVAHVTAPHHANDWKLDRQAVFHQLESTPGQHLVFVRYAPHHNTHCEWVYNRADIDSAKVVWAREMDDSRNQRLAEYFGERRVWIVEADQPNPHPVEWQSKK